MFVFWCSAEVTCSLHHIIIIMLTNEYVARCLETKQDTRYTILSKIPTHSRTRNPIITNANLISINFVRHQSIRTNRNSYAFSFTSGLSSLQLFLICCQIVVYSVLAVRRGALLLSCGVANENPVEYVGQDNRNPIRLSGSRGATSESDGFCSDMCTCWIIGLSGYWTWPEWFFCPYLCISRRPRR